MTGYVVEVVAHEDDDLFFINEDMQAAIAAGLPAVTVYVTAGQLSGNGSTPGDRARSRQLGAMAAHAQMAGVTSPRWVGEVLWVAGRQVEHYTLANAASPVEVVFCNLPDGGMNTIYTGGTGTTILVTGGLVTRTFTYARADVVNLLAGLMARYQPTVLHHQDPLPDSRYTADHADHIATANLAGQAAAGYSDSLLVVAYRDYNIADAPVDLDAADTTAKTATANAYLAYDSGASTSGWLSRMYPRWPRGTTWVGRNADGRLQVWLVRSGQVWTWWQLTGGGWSQPLNTGVPGPVAAGVSVCPNADGRLQIFARRLDTHTIVTSWQTAVNGGWSSWLDLGSPNAGMSNANQIGCPYAALSTGGLICMWFKNGGGGVSGVAQTSANGPFGSWLDLGGGPDVQDGVAAACNPGGCWEVVASTRSAVQHWYQTAVGGPYTLDSAYPAGVPASPPTAVKAQDGTVAVAYRAATTGETTVNAQTTPSGAWAAAVTATGRPGTAPVAVCAPAGTGHQPMLAARGTTGTVSVAWPNGAGGWTWTDLPGGPFIDTPAVSIDPAGTVTLVAAGFDGRLYTCTQTAAGAGQPFGAWQALPA